MYIGERIRQLRLHKKLTQGELVDGICSITYLSRVENNQIKPSYNCLSKIAYRLGVALTIVQKDDIPFVERRRDGLDVLEWNSTKWTPLLLLTPFD